MGLDSFLAGYHGEDSMRTKAERMLNPKFMGVNMHIPESMSAPDRTKVRLYKKGGHVHKLTHEQTDMKLPRRVKHKKLNVQNFYEAEHMHSGGEMRRGGHAHHGHHEHHSHHEHHAGKERKRAMLHREQEHELSKARHLIEKEKKLKHGGHAHHRRHKADGGTLMSTLNAMRGMPMKKGGHAHKKHHYATGGILPGLAKSALGALGAMRGLPLKKGGTAHHRHHHKHHYADGGEMMHILPHHEHGEKVYKRGGHAHHGHHEHHSHHRKHKAHGGTIYEHQMVGEHPSHKMHHYNYEAEMMGERPIRAPREVHSSRKGLHDMSHGQYLARGGRTHHKMAMGGVGKIRHGVASKRGLPLSRKVRGV
jgi:hypothetical protein